MKRLAFVVLILAACSSNGTKTSQTSSPSQTGSGSAVAEPTGSEPTGSGSAAPTTTGGAGIGEQCGEHDACGPGLECVSYYGIAGAKGPQFKSCEVKCADQKACPDGKKCVTIADGPGQVCR